MVPLIWNIWNRQIHKDRKWVRGYQGLQGDGDGEWLVNDYRDSDKGDGKDLKTNSANPCTTSLM